MSLAEEFYQMAFEMLNDPDVASHATLRILEQTPDPDKPWEVITTPKDYSVACFYFKPKNALINGTVVQKGQKSLLLQSPLPEVSLHKAQFIDHNNKVWNVVTSENIELADEPIYQKVLIGV